MNSKNLKLVIAFCISITASLALRGTSVLPKNFRNQLSATVLVHEASRISHAKELLGKNYEESDARKLEGQEALNNIIHKKVRSSLPANWKKQSRKITETVLTESAKYSMDPIFVLAVIQTESKFNPTIVGRHGEIGLMQIKPSTAAWIAKKYKIQWNNKSNLQNPSANIQIGMAYMDYLRNKFKRKSTKYVSAYNMGPTNVQRLLAANIKPDQYNSKVMKNYRDFYSTMSASVSKPIFTLVAKN